MKKLAAVTTFVLAAVSTSVFAAPKTVTLSVPGMDCAICPITVRKALRKVDGVERVEVDLDKHQAVVRFDDKRTNVQALIDATRNAGYSSTPAEQPK